ncbi:MAG TPA: PspC domain-containing protein [Candidatus Cloacimonadota bacterium]|nr:PspC domain-containing protein [Candidatus Cloacimonadota bacterium]
MKQVHISRENKVILGVCGGIAESFDLAPNLVRVLFVLSLLAGSAGFWIYLVLAVILPKSDQEVEIIEVTDEEKKEHKKIYRLWENRILGGVCIGLAKHFGWDVTVVRIAFVILTFAGSLGIFLYLILWLVLPNEE